MKKIVASLDNLDSIVNEILSTCRSGVVILEGDLASGKTTLVKHIVKALGIKEEVTSPTFSLQHCYENSVYHYDIYNHGLDHFISLGMLEELEKPALHFVEWGDDKLKEILEMAEIEHIKVAITKIDNNKREYTICTN